MAEYKIPKYTFKPPTAEDYFRQVAELSYKSPVEIVSQGLKSQVENDVMKVTHSYGISIDRDELVKALKYDRDQYKQGYADACMVRKGKIYAEVAREIFGEIGKIKKEYASGDIDDKELYLRLYMLKKKYTERCPDCKHFVGCECFSGQTCDEYEEVEK